MKVYGGNLFLRGVQVRGIIASTQKQVAKVANLSLHYVREYWTETGNEKEISVAKSEPGVLFWCPLNHRSDEYQRAEQCVHTDPPSALVSAADSINTAGG